MTYSYLTNEHEFPATVCAPVVTVSNTLGKYIGSIDSLNNKGLII